MSAQGNALGWRLSVNLKPWRGGTTSVDGLRAAPSGLQDLGRSLLRAALPLVACPGL